MKEYISLKPLMGYFSDPDVDIIVMDSVRNTGKSYTAYQEVLDKWESGDNVVISRYDYIELRASQDTVMNMLYQRGYSTDKDSSDRVISISGTQFNKTISYGDHHIRLCTITDSQKHKGIDFPYSIWFIDEFVPITYKTSVRMRTEYMDFEQLRQTLQRNYPKMRVIMACNNLHWLNPYFARWGIQPFPPGKPRKIRSGGLTVVIWHIALNQRIYDRCKHDYMNQGYSEDEWNVYYEGHTIEQSVVIGRPKGERVSRCIKFMGKYYTFKHEQSGRYWCTECSRYDPCLTVSYVDIEPHVKRKPEYINRFINRYEKGRLAFDSTETHRAFISMMNASRERVYK